MTTFVEVGKDWVTLLRDFALLVLAVLLIVFPSQDGPHGDRGERVCYELSSEHLETASRKIGEALPD